MKKLRLFHVADGQAERQPASLFQYERELQDLLEQHLHNFLDVHFLAREFPTDSGYIDTLGLDDAGRPVIIEYKRSMNQAVVDQGLDYRGWLLDRRADFRLLVMDKLGNERAQHIDWSPRLLIIAGDYTDRQMRAARQVPGIELLRYRRYGQQGIALEWVHGGEEEPVAPPHPAPAPVPAGTDPVPAQTPSEPEPIAGNGVPFSINASWRRANAEMQELFLELRKLAESLGDDVRLDAFKSEFSFKRVSPARQPVFAYLNLRIRKRSVELAIVATPPGVKRQYHNASVQDRAELEKLEPLLRKAYELLRT